MFGKNRNKKVGLCVMVVTAGLILATLWAVLAAPETALAKKPGGGGGGGGKKQEISVSVTFRDDVGDGVKSDDGGAYTRERGNKVKAFIGMGGQLRLQTWDSTVRSIILNIPEIIGSGCPKGDFGHAGLITLGEDDGGLNGDGFLTEGQLDPGVKGDRLDLLAMDPGDENSTKAGLRILFPVPDNKNGDAWRLIFGEVNPGDGSSPLTNLVTVTRVSDSVWTIEAGADDLAMAALVRIDQEPRPRVPCAWVSMPFRIKVEILP